MCLLQHVRWKHDRKEVAATKRYNAILVKGFSIFECIKAFSGDEEGSHLQGKYAGWLLMGIKAYLQGGTTSESEFYIPNRKNIVIEKKNNNILLW